MAVIVDIAEAVKDELNAGSFSQPFTSERAYQPTFKLEEMQTLHVTVVPKGVTTAAATRSEDQYEYSIDIGIQKKFQEQSELDGLMALVEEIADFLKRRTLSSCPEAVWVSNENTPIFAREHLDELRQFTSVLTVSYRVLR